MREYRVISLILLFTVIFGDIIVLLLSPDITPVLAKVMQYSLAIVFTNFVICYSISIYHLHKN